MMDLALEGKLRSKEAELIKTVGKKMALTVMSKH